MRQTRRRKQAAVFAAHDQSIARSADFRSANLRAMNRQAAERRLRGMHPAPPALRLASLLSAAAALVVVTALSTFALTAPAATEPAGAGAAKGENGSCQASFRFDFKSSLLRTGMREAGWSEALTQDVMQNHAEKVKFLLSRAARRADFERIINKIFGQEGIDPETAEEAWRLEESPFQIPTIKPTPAKLEETWRRFAESPSVLRYRSLVSAARGPALKGADVIGGFIDKGKEAAVSLGRMPTVRENGYIWLAHKAGEGEPGKDGDPAFQGNHTQGQLRLKSRILQEGGFSRYERGRLIRDGVTGSLNDGETVRRDVFWRPIDSVVYIPDKAITAAASKESFFKKATVDDADALPDYFDGMSAAAVIRDYRANYDLMFDQILRHHVQFEFAGEPFIGYAEISPLKISGKLKQLFSSSSSKRKLWREPGSYETAVAEDLIRAAFGERPFRRITKSILYPESFLPPAYLQIYSLSEIQKQQKLLQTAGYSDAETARLYNVNAFARHPVRRRDVWPKSLYTGAPEYWLPVVHDFKEFWSGDFEQVWTGSKNFHTTQALFAMQERYFNDQNDQANGSPGGEGRKRQVKKFNDVHPESDDRPDLFVSRSTYQGEVFNVKPLRRQITAAVRSDQETVRAWEEKYGLSPPAAKDLFFQAVRHRVVTEYIHSHFDVNTREGLIALYAWIGKNTI